MVGEIITGECQSTYSNLVRGSIVIHRSVCLFSSAIIFSGFQCFLAFMVDCHPVSPQLESKGWRGRDGMRLWETHISGKETEEESSVGRRGIT